MFCSFFVEMDGTIIVDSVCFSIITLILFANLVFVLLLDMSLFAAYIAINYAKFILATFVAHGMCITVVWLVRLIRTIPRIARIALSWAVHTTLLLWCLFTNFATIPLSGLKVVVMQPLEDAEAQAVEHFRTSNETAQYYVFYSAAIVGAVCRTCGATNAWTRKKPYPKRVSQKVAPVCEKPVPRWVYYWVYPAQCVRQLVFGADLYLSVISTATDDDVLLDHFELRRHKPFYQRRDLTYMTSPRCDVCGTNNSIEFEYHKFWCPVKVTYTVE